MHVQQNNACSLKLLTYNRFQVIFYYSIAIFKVFPVLFMQYTRVYAMFYAFFPGLLFPMKETKKMRKTAIFPLSQTLRNISPKRNFVWERRFSKKIIR